MGVHAFALPNEEEGVRKRGRFRKMADKGDSGKRMEMQKWRAAAISRKFIEKDQKSVASLRIQRIMHACCRSARATGSLTSWTGQSVWALSGKRKIRPLNDVLNSQFRQFSQNSES